MYIKNYPVRLTKNGKTRVAYHTVTLDELLNDGWVAEGKKEAPKKDVKLDPVKTEVVTITLEEPKPIEAITMPVAVETNEATRDSEEDIDSMSKVELIEYANELGLTTKNMLKAEIVDLVNDYLVRTRNADGTFIGDNPSTPDVNEAWMQVAKEEPVS